MIKGESLERVYSQGLLYEICPWGILAATIAKALTGKDIELNPSEFNEIGALTKLKIAK